jgi:large subunit ribosomal protein L6
MSKLAKKHILIPQNVIISKNNNIINISGPKGSIEYQFMFSFSMEIYKEDNDQYLKFEVSDIDSRSRLLGTIYAIVKNMIYGVIFKFKKKLLLIGVGYKAKMLNKSQIELSLGFSHTIIYSFSSLIDVTLSSPTEIVIEGCSKEEVGKVAADIRNYRKPDAYKGKGIRYSDEKIKLKVSKKQS